MLYGTSTVTIIDGLPSSVQYPDGVFFGIADIDRAGATPYNTLVGDSTSEAEDA
jgi:hypothetical protein